MASISSRVFGAVTKKYLSIGNGEYKRTLSISNNWTTIRIGVLLAQNPNGTSDITSGTRLILAMCSGTTFGFGGGSSTVNVVGVNFTGRSFSGNNWFLSYNANSGNPYYSGAGGIGFFKKVGATITDFGNDSAPKFVAPSTTGSTQRRFPIYVHIVKGSPNYTVHSITPPDGSTDFSVADFETGLQVVSTTPTINGKTFIDSSTTVATSEAAGNYDTVDFYTNFTEAAEIYEIGAYKFA